MDIIGLATPEVADEIARLREENARLKEEMRMNDPASYSSMVYWREKCYEARAKLAKVVEAAEAYVEPHSAACCTPTPGDGTFPPGPLTPNWCKCRDRTRALRVALAAAKGE